MGYEEYEPLAAKFSMPIVVTGFEPLDLLEGVYRCVCMLEAGRWAWKTSTRAPSAARAIRPARGLVDEVFEVTDRKWRGIGTIPQSGYRLRPEYAEYDAERGSRSSELQVLESDSASAA